MLEILYNRRSTRKFLEKPVAEDKIEQLMKAALLSPTSKNSRPWAFIVVDDPKLLQLMAEAKPHGAALLKHAPLAIIIAGDKSKSDVWVEDCSIATIIIQLEAEALGLGSCWVQVHRRFYNDNVTANEYVSQHLGIPNNLEVLSIVGVGYKAAERPCLTDKDLLWERVSRNKYTINPANE